MRPVIRPRGFLIIATIFLTTNILWMMCNFTNALRLRNYAKSSPAHVICMYGANVVFEDNVDRVFVGNNVITLEAPKYSLTFAGVACKIVYIDNKVDMK